VVLTCHLSSLLARILMFSGAYSPLFLEVETPQGPVDALTFVMGRNNRRYMPDLLEDEAAQMIAVAEGAWAQCRIPRLSGPVSRRPWHRG